jgi:hypothetical protein
MGPEDREGSIERRRISRDRILGSHPSVAPGWLNHKCYQWSLLSEDLGPVLQMEKSRQSMRMGWGRLASLRKGSHPFFQVREGRRRANVSWQVVFIPLWSWRWRDNMSSPGSSHLWGRGRSSWVMRGSSPRLSPNLACLNRMLENFSFLDHVSFPPPPRKQKQNWIQLELNTYFLTFISSIFETYNLVDDRNHVHFLKFQYFYI